MSILLQLLPESSQDLQTELRWIYLTCLGSSSCQLDMSVRPETPLIQRIRYAKTVGHPTRWFLYWRFPELVL